MKNKFIKGHWYKIKDYWGDIFVVEYVGKQDGFECCVCNKGNNAYTFNHWYSIKNDEGKTCYDYETWGFGKEHLPMIIEDYGKGDEIILD